MASSILDKISVVLALACCLPQQHCSFVSAAPMPLKPPSIGLGSFSPIVTEGDSINSTLSCTTFYIEPVELQWFKDGTLVPANQQSFASGRLGNFFSALNELNISVSGVFSKSEAGNYTCVVTRLSDMSILSTTYTLTVNVPAMGLRIDGPSSVLIGTDFSLTCNARGNFPLTYVWRRSSAILQSGARRNTTDVLTVRGATVASSGVYTCSVMNTIGGPSSISKMVTVFRMPTLRAGFAFSGMPSASASRRATLMWNNDIDNGNSPITSFSPSCQSVDLNSNHVRAPPVVPFDVNSPVYVVEVLNLHPGATYRCTLTITNAAGSVVASGADFTAAQEPPSQPVRNVVSLPISPTVANLTWQDPPADTHFGRLIAYRVTYTAVGCGACSCVLFPCRLNGSLNISVASQSGTPLIVLSGLRRFTTYSIRVALQNSAGYGNASMPVSVTTNEDVPSPVRSLRVFSRESTVGLVVQWQQPLEPNGRLIRYEIAFTPFNNTVQAVSGVIRQTNAAISSLAAQEFVITAITRRTVYNISVREFTSAGGSPWVNSSAQTQAWPSVIVGRDLVSVDTRMTSLSLTCIVDGDPTPNVSWLLQPSTSDSTVVPANADGSLLLRNLNKASSGLYVCQASNLWGTVTRNTQLVITDPVSSDIIAGFPDAALIAIMAATGVVLIVAVVLVIVKCRKHRTNKAYSRRMSGRVYDISMATERAERLHRQHVPPKPLTQSELVGQQSSLNPLPSGVAAAVDVVDGIKCRAPALEEGIPLANIALAARSRSAQGSTPHFSVGDRPEGSERDLTSFSRSTPMPSSLPPSSRLYSTPIGRGGSELSDTLPSVSRISSTGTPACLPPLFTSRNRIDPRLRTRSRSGSGSRPEGSGTLNRASMLAAFENGKGDGSPKLLSYRHAADSQLAATPFSEADDGVFIPAPTAIDTRDTTVDANGYMTSSC